MKRIRNTQAFGVIQLPFPPFHDSTIPSFQIHGTENGCQQIYDYHAKA
jgi:hypothetical protein